MASKYTFSLDICLWKRGRPQWWPQGSGSEGWPRTGGLMRSRLPGKGTGVLLLNDHAPSWGILVLVAGGLCPLHPVPGAPMWPLLSRRYTCWAPLATACQGVADTSRSSLSCLLLTSACDPIWGESLGRHIVESSGESQKQWFILLIRLF